MLHEFALDPQLLNNWKDLRYFADMFGAHTGRLISEFPENWAAAVLAACSDAKPVEKLRIVNVLECAKKKLLPTKRKYSEVLPWLDNAENGHKETPFHAIVSSENPRSHPSVLLGGELCESLPTGGVSLWNVKRQNAIERTPEALAAAAGKLLSISKSILFIDPYFAAEDEGEWNQTLKAMLKAAGGGRRPLTRCEYHTAAPNDEHTLEFRKANYEAHLSKYVPRNWFLKIVMWNKRESTDWLHWRYVLTEIGGIVFEGLNKGSPGETCKAILLEPALYDKIWRDFQMGSKAFEYVDQILVAGRST